MMQNNEINYKISASKQYSNFAGLLIGFSITFTTILLTLSTKEIKNNIFFEYAIAAFITSAFTFLQASEFFIYFTRNKNDIHYDIASYLYYIGYLSMVLGVVYLLKLFDINYALVVSYIFLGVSFIFLIDDSRIAIFREKKLIDIVCLLSIIIIYSLVVYFTLIKW